MTGPRSHGARSQVEVAKVAGYCKQSLLQRLRIRQADLPPVDRYLLDKWARIEAEVLLMERYIVEHGGPLDENGEPWAFTKTLYAARNSATRLLTKLEPRLLKAAKAKEGDSAGALERHISKQYGKGET